MRERTAPEVFLAFLKLGLVSFGGPVAHLGYFRQEFVVRRRWVNDAAYSDLVALCQVLPGPASSQVGFSLGLMRARYPGALAAWAGFTLPSAVLMTLLALGSATLAGPISLGMIHALKLVALAVVAQAVWGMQRTLCPDRTRAAIAVAGVAIVLLSNSALAQLAVILMGGVAGLWLCRSSGEPVAGALSAAVSPRVGVLALAVLLGLLALLPLLAPRSHAVAVLAAFYRCGALVFGGGHVVLPLLSHAFVTPGWVTQDSFLAGYAAAQAMPGPLFAFAAYLGAVGKGPVQGVAGAVLGIAGIFLPGMLVLLGILPFWSALRQRIAVQAALRGVNAAVVGLLAAALYNPLWINSVGSARDLAVAVAAFVLLTAGRVPPFIIVILGALCGIAMP